MKTKKIFIFACLAALTLAFTACQEPEQLTLTGITAVFDSGTTKIYTDTPLNNLKNYLTVTATYDNDSTKPLNASEYTLSVKGGGTTLIVGENTITVTYEGETDAFNVTVFETPTRKFWAQNMATEDYYQTNAKLLYEGIHCNVWVETTSGKTAAAAKQVADAYDQIIYQKMIDTFSFSNLSDEYGTYSNAMEFADEALGDKDGKLCILLLDIKDDYKKNDDPYVEGYFWAGDLYNGEHSNSSDMIYIDTNPGEPGSKESNMTLAHEMQHLMNFATTSLVREFEMDVWIDEGLSAAAEWIYTNEHSQDKIQSYNENWSELIDKGNNFFVWDNHQDNPYAIIDDYSTVYLFFQWLRIQANGPGIYKDIITSEEYDYFAVTEAAGDKIDGDYGDGSWDLLLRDWLAANYIKAAAGRYGYGNDAVLKDITSHILTTAETTIDLYPGEGVYSKVDATFTDIPVEGDYIKYAGLNKTIPQVSDDSVFTNGVLLTYNTDVYFDIYDPDYQPTIEEGAITGIASIGIAPAQGRFVTTPPRSFRIDARDLLRRNGAEGNLPNSDLQRNSRRVVR